MKTHVFRKFIVYLYYLITCLYAGLVSRGILYRGYYCQKPFFYPYLNTKATELSFCVHLHFFVHLGRHKTRMRVEGAKHPFNRTIYHLLWFFIFFILQIFVPSSQFLSFLRKQESRILL